VNYDAALTLTAGPASATTGQPAVITGTVTNDGPLSGPITFTDPVPSGLTVNAVGIGSGTCSTNTAVDIVTCTTDGLAAHQSTPVVIAVTPTAAGTYKDSATVSLSGAGADPNLANNSASATLTVTKAGTPTQCVVPKLKGAPLALGKKVLPLLGCKVGKVKKSTSKSVAKGDVISTSPGAGSYAASKSIGITVSSGKPKPKPKKKKK
jgi:serine/threonine-protein kinase